MDNLEFKEISDEYLPEVLKIYNYFVLNTTVSFHTEARTLAEIKESVMSKNPRYPTYMIEQENEIKGYVLITQHKNRQAYEGTGEVTIYLKPECGGQGIGGRALAFIEEIARKIGFHVLIATICTENERSKTLFEKNGYTQAAHFKEIGYKFGRRLDIWSYQKMMK
jgi:L-amino acid N-acyltransferase YncA